MGETILEVKDLSFAYRKDKEIFKNVSFTLNSGEIISIIGPNGTGKTTLIKCVLSLLKPQKGTVKVDGVNIKDMSHKERSRKISYVPQAGAMIFNYRVIDVLVIGRVSHFKGGGSASIKDIEIVNQVIADLEIEHLKYSQFNELSGGEKQMVYLARAIVQDAKIIIMDEPTSNLDYKNQIKILKVLNDLAIKNYSIIMTSHFPEHALFLKTKALLLKGKRVFEYGEALDVISSESLTSLYETKIHVDAFKNKEDLITCTPIFGEALKGGNSNEKQN